MRDRFSIRHQAERKEERLDPVGIDERRGERGESERRPAARGLKTRFGRRLRHRLERERPDQHEAEDEAAVHVRPRRHQRGEPERRGAAVIAGGDEPGAPGRGNRQRQHMRPSKQVRRHERKPDRDDRHERRASKVARRGQPHDQRRGRDGGASQQRDAAPSAKTERKRQQNFSQPFMRGPWRASHRIAERVGARRAPVGKDPFAGRQMRPCVAIAKHLGRERGEREQKDRDRGQAEPGESRLSCVIARGADKRQGEGHRPSLSKPQ